MGSQTLIVQEAADLLRVKKPTIYCWNHSHKKNENGYRFPTQKAGGKLLFDEHELRIWMRGGNPRPEQ